MAYFSQTTIIGNCTRDPESKTTPRGTAVTEVSVAVNKKVNDEEKVSYFDVRIWGKTGEIAAKYLKKGSSVLLTGEMEQQRWEKNGEKKSAWVLNAREMQLLTAQQSKPKAATASDDDVPF